MKIPAPMPIVGTPLRLRTIFIRSGEPQNHRNLVTGSLKFDGQAVVGHFYFHLIEAAKNFRTQVA